MISFEDLASKARVNNPDSDIDLLQRAYEFSALEHTGQVRRSGEAYITHPLEVAALVADMKLDDVAIAAGLLHDVVEDTLTTIESVGELFGSEVAHVVEGVTKISTIPFSSSEERQAENFRKMLLAMVGDVRVILVKLADRLHNMRTLGSLSEEQRVKIAQETLDIYAPIAHRLGMSKIKNELEELAFRHLEPKAYETLRAWMETRRPTTERAMADFKQTLAKHLDASGIPIVEIEGRLKRLFSIWQKLKRQQISPRRGVRHRGPARHHAVGPRLLRGARHHPPDLGSRAGAVQGLRRHAAPQRLPVAAYVGHQRSRVSNRGADPFRADAPGGRGRHRGALEVQGGARRCQRRRAVFRVAPAITRVAKGSPRPERVHTQPKDRPVPGGGVHVHAAGRS